MGNWAIGAKQMTVSKSDIDDATLIALRKDFRTLRSKTTTKDSQIQSLIAMASLHYEIEEVLAAGATQKSVIEIFQSRGFSVSKTNFAHNLFRLRKLFPQRRFTPEIDIEKVEAVAESLSIMKAANAAATVAAAEKVKKEIEIRALRPKKVKPQQASKESVDTIPMSEKVLLCGRLVYRLASDSHFDAENVQDDLRKNLGNGWTISALMQFVSGVKFGEWTQAPWPDNKDAGQIQIAHHVARTLALGYGAFPPNDLVKGLAKRSFDEKMGRLSS